MTGIGMAEALREDVTEVEAGNNAPLLLEDPEAVFMVVHGALDVFAVPVEHGRGTGPRDYLFSVPEGDVLFGMEPEWADEVGLMAVGSVGTKVVQRRLEDFKTLAGVHEEEARDLVDRYVSNFSGAVADRHRPRIDVSLEPDDRHDVPKGAAMEGRRGVVWARFDHGSLLFDGYRSLRVGPQDGPFPLGGGGWACAEDDMQIAASSAAGVFADGSVWEGLRTFQRTALEWARRVLDSDHSAAGRQLAARVEAERASRERALGRLATVLSTPHHRVEVGAGDDIFTTCELVANAMNVVLRPMPGRRQGTHPMEAVREILRGSSVGFRKVALDPGWWRRDQGPLIGILLEERKEAVPAEDEDERVTVQGHDDGERVTDITNEWEDQQDDRYPVPVALLPTEADAYELVHTGRGTRTPVDEDLAAELAPFGLQIYRGLPARSIGMKDIWEFVRQGIGWDLRAIVLLGIAGALLGLLTPWLTGYLFDTVIPGARRVGLVNVFVALAVATLAGATFELTRSFAVLRLHTRIGSALQLAVMDRLVRLPLPFYRRFNAGDLGDRASGINAIGDQLNGAAVSSILSSVVAAGAYALLFYYSWKLAILATLILLANVVFSTVTAYLAMRYAREGQEAEGKLQGLVLQLLAGITKLRASGTEAKGFELWAGAFRRRQEVGFRRGSFENNVVVFNSMLSIVSTLAIFWAYMLLARNPETAVTTGQFIAFMAAFGTFMHSGLELSDTAISFLSVIPMWERAQPILEAVPEVDVTRADPGELTGHIEVSHLSFRYGDDGPLILDDVSIEAAPGEFIALVGPSGAGKSTLLRVLLGFERTESSSVFLDGQDLSTIDITAVRRQIGVVLQSSMLTAGDVLRNIIGDAPLTLQDAWDAVAMAGLQEDLRKMPMGMHTVLPEGGFTLSGGQRQRLLIARALVTRPRILFFDEATSALDNRAQAKVSESVRSMRATRVVIAHRLSTIRDADRIYVLDGGKVVQAGSYAELMSESGLFADLAARQEI